MKPLEIRTGIHSRLHLAAKRSEYGSIKPGVQNDTFKLEQLVATHAI